MYKKIMPSAARAASAADDEDDEDDESPAQRPTRAGGQQERFAGAQLDKLAASVRKRVAELGEDDMPQPLTPRRRPEPAFEEPEEEPVAAEYPQPAPVEEKPQPALAPRPVAAPRPVVAAEPAPPITPPRPSLVNIMELLVDERVGEVVAKFHCCRCDKCRKDIVAITLNTLTPRYIVLDELESPLIADRKTVTEVTSALIKAVLTVKARPRH